MSEHPASIGIGSPRWDRANPGLLWRRILASGGDDGQALRRWQFWIWWSRPRTPRERLAAVIGTALSPATILVDALRTVRTHGDKVARLHRISRGTQFLDVVLLCTTTGLPPVSYYKFQLFHPDRRPHASQYLEDAGKLLQVLSRRIPDTPDLAVFVDKHRFEIWCNEHRLPTVANLLVVDDGTVTHRAVDSLPPVSLFSKPTNLRAGKGTLRWRHEYRDGASAWSDSQGGFRTAEALEADLRALSLRLGRPLVVQKLLHNHPAVHRLANGGLSTVRFMTLREHGRPAEPFRAILRLPVGNAVADNFDLGGIAVPVDLASGECGRAVCKRGHYPPDQLEHHPDTGVRLCGSILPHWEECKALALRAHNALVSTMPIIGWDIAILDDGPILIEANHMPCSNLAQMPGGAPLGSTRYAACLVSHLRAAFSV